MARKKPANKTNGMAIREPTRPRLEARPPTKKVPKAPPPETDSPGQKTVSLGPGQMRVKRAAREKTERVRPKTILGMLALPGRPLRKRKEATKNMGAGQKEAKPNHSMRWEDKTAPTVPMWLWIWAPAPARRSAARWEKRARTITTARMSVARAGTSGGKAGACPALDFWAFFFLASAMNPRTPRDQGPPKGGPDRPRAYY